MVSCEDPSAVLASPEGMADRQSMRFTCTKCGTRYRIDPERLRGRIIKVRCRSCDTVLKLRDPKLSKARTAKAAPGPAPARDTTPRQSARLPEEGWYHVVDGKPEGPVALSLLVQRAAQKLLGPEDLIWQPSWSEWLPASTVPLLMKARTAPTPPPPPAQKPQDDTEERGFDSTPTAGAVADLLGWARELVPGLEEAAVREINVGFRPATPDGGPALGWLGDGRLVAVGHHRNGILLAPLTGDAVAALVAGRDLPEVWEPFRPDRFVGGPQGGTVAG